MTVPHRWVPAPLRWEATRASKAVTSHEKGYSAVLYLTHEKKYVDECGPANFFGIKEQPHHPKSDRSYLHHQQSLI